MAQNVLISAQGTLVVIKTSRLLTNESTVYSPKNNNVVNSN